MALWTVVLSADPGLRNVTGRGEADVRRGGAGANPRYNAACDPATAPNNFCQPPEMPGTPNLSWGAEAFLDTMIVNGTAYPTVTVSSDGVPFPDPERGP